MSEVLEPIMDSDELRAIAFRIDHDAFAARGTPRHPETSARRIAAIRQARIELDGRPSR